MTDWNLFLYIGLAIFVLASLGLIVFGWNHLYIAWLAWKGSAAHNAALERARKAWFALNQDWPSVAVQIPLYNEPAVAERCLRAIAALDYPDLYIQVLDDSTDDTTRIAQRVVDELRARGLKIELIHRDNRQGFKAGALAQGLKKISTRYVAIFDADFAPSPDFLKRAVPLFSFGPRVGCVQGRWTHFNAEENRLTQLQAVSIDAHFGAQQLGRSAADLPMNSNGSVTVWDLSVIEDVGGWSSETITEDLELSYRAQLAGYRLVFDPNLTCPGELPSSFKALRSQQRRWACGSIHTSRLYLKEIWTGSWSLARKWYGTMHLLGYLASSCMVLQMLSAPCAWWYYKHHLADKLPNLPWIWLTLLLLLPSSLMLCRVGARMTESTSRFRRVWPWMFLLGAGLAPNALWATWRGIFKPWKTFVRTEKKGDGQMSAFRPDTFSLPYLCEYLFLLLGAGYLLWAVQEEAWLICFWALWLGIGLIWALIQTDTPRPAVEPATEKAAIRVRYPRQ